MPAQCYFTLNSQRVSSLVCAGFGGVPAFSGNRQFVDKPDATTVANAGPIPKGRYYIVKRGTGGRLGPIRDLALDLWSNSDRSTWFALYRADAKIDDETYVNGVKRSAFRLHPNGRWGVSDGCITVTTQVQFDQLRAYLVKQPTAKIPGTDIEYYGTVDVR
ncbi:Protein of uncharacterised function (DUF2778) [Burkholderia pseudomallei]|uniref:DUF2778 domain-containing protein n=1 Tax=pseudomallei group TaxID=111527 RepID=UPI000F0DE912|nr:MULTISPECIES: DUF2778 domain-containing protein [pseudomallei group]WNO23848.1 hypothetical protein PhiBTCVTUL1a_39 [Burkholderia phage phiBtTUL1a]MCS6455990.1 DUF2778 domain-containing protein [Burkholderia thailandensis]MCS6482705.1 DUF2778 domain-containing protein [Burkholderia thailandensis]MCS6492478.1 DUF2778 domain-containing protein [Burkholderia thailandensis]MCS6516994.1 DUF2778 domain-containing protein [Burkholderia thailandensis]